MRRGGWETHRLYSADGQLLGVDVKARDVLGSCGVVKRAVCRSRNKGKLSASTSLSIASGALVVGLMELSVANAQTETRTDPAPGLEPIVVTARKRSEDLQKTPVAETVLSASQANELNVHTFQDLRGLVPNLEVLPLAAANAVSLTIRGIGQTSVQANVDNKVGFYLDDLYIARSEGNQLSFFDVDSTQVLKGPQGTLFGKNTTAGALLLTTKRPSALDSGYIDVRGGNYNQLDTEGAVNIPLTDNVLTRLSFRTESEDGYIKHVLDNKTTLDANDKSGRAQLRLTPTDQLTVDVLGEYNVSHTNGGTMQLNGVVVTACNPNTTGQRRFAELHGATQCALYPILNQRDLVYGGATMTAPMSAGLFPLGTGGDYNNGVNFARRASPFSDVTVSTANLRWNYQFNDEFSLKSITGVRNSASAWYNSSTNTPDDIYAELDHTGTHQVSQEFDFSGKLLGDKLHFVAGLYYSNQRTEFTQDSGPDYSDPVGYTYVATNTFSSEAVFAQATYEVLDRLHLTVGARYNFDRKKAASDVFLQTVFTGPCAAGGGHSGYYNAFIAGSRACGGHLIGADQKSWTDFDPRVQLDFQLTPDIMTYVGATGGYNAGGFNQQLGSNLGGHLVSYNPERVWSYESGIKSEWYDHRLRVNVDGFYQTYEQIQTTVLVIYNGVNTRAIQNAAAAHEDGIELEVAAAPIPDFNLSANFAYLDQAYDKIGPGVTAFTLKTPVTTAARHTGAILADYTLHMPSDATLVPSLNWRYVGAKPSCTPIGSCYTPSYSLLGGRLDYHTADGKWTVGLWATNILDKYYYHFYSAGLSSITNGITSVLPGEPRKFGAELRREF